MADLKFVQCVSCGGTYPPLQADGTEYYHVCPSRRLVGTQPAPTAADPTATAPLYEVIKNPRNENVVVNPSTGAVDIVSAGGGIEIAAAPVPVNSQFT